MATSTAKTIADDAGSFKFPFLTHTGRMWFPLKNTGN